MKEQDTEHDYIIYIYENEKQKTSTKIEIVFSLIQNNYYYENQKF